MGVQRDGSFREYIVMPVERIYAGKGLSAKELALVEPFTISYHALHRAPVKKGDKVKINEPLGLVIADAAGNCTMQFQLRKDKQSLNPEQWVAF